MHDDEWHGGWLASLTDVGAKLTRLLNDVRSYEKEVEEGKVNSIGILMKNGMTKAGAVEQINAVYEHDMRHLLHQTLAANAAHRPFYQLVFDLCRTTAWFYQSNDFHAYQKALLEVTPCP